MNTYEQYVFKYQKNNPFPSNFIEQRPMIDECEEYKGLYIYLRTEESIYKWYKDGKIVVYDSYDNTFVYEPKPTLNEIINSNLHSLGVIAKADGTIIINVGDEEICYFGPIIDLDYSNIDYQGLSYIAVYYEDDGECKNINPIFENYYY